MDWYDGYDINDFQEWKTEIIFYQSKINETDKAIQYFFKRKNGSPFPKGLWIPKSVIIAEFRDKSIEIEGWFFEKELKSLMKEVDFFGD